MSATHSPPAGHALDLVAWSGGREEGEVSAALGFVPTDPFVRIVAPPVFLSFDEMMKFASDQRDGEWIHAIREETGVAFNERLREFAARLATRKEAIVNLLAAGAYAECRLAVPFDVGADRLDLAALATIAAVPLPFEAAIGGANAPPADEFIGARVVFEGFSLAAEVAAALFKTAPSACEGGFRSQLSFDFAPPPGGGVRAALDKALLFALTDERQAVATLQAASGFACLSLSIAEDEDLANWLPFRLRTALQAGLAITLRNAAMRIAQAQAIWIDPQQHDHLTREFRFASDERRVWLDAHRFAVVWERDERIPHGTGRSGRGRFDLWSDSPPDAWALIDEEIGLRCAYLGEGRVLVRCGGREVEIGLREEEMNVRGVRFTLGTEKMQIELPATGAFSVEAFDVDAFDAAFSEEAIEQGEIAATVPFTASA